MEVLLNDRKTKVKLVICHSNIKKNAAGEIKTVIVKPGYTFVFLTEAGFCFISTQSKWNVFKNENKIIELLTSNAQNALFSKGFNSKGDVITYNTFKVMYTANMEMPEHEIEIASIIGDAGGIYTLPLANNFSEVEIEGKWNNLINNLSKDVGFDPSKKKNKEVAFTNDSKSRIKNYITFKHAKELEFGKLSHRYYSSTKVNTTLDFFRKYHKEIKLNKKKNIRAGRTLGKMMDKKSEFYVPPGIYIIAGCRNIGFNEEPAVSSAGIRMRYNGTMFNNKDKKAKELNMKAKRYLTLKT